MCGIVGYIGPRDAAAILLEGLHRLEYRGYDSAGMALVKRGRLRLCKRQGRVGVLEAALPEGFTGSPGIAHTRWATHGEPSDANAHPHCDAGERIAVVHNGIIENATSLRKSLEKEGVAFSSETDSEVLAHLIARAQGGTLEARVRAALAQVTGTYGLAVIDSAEPEVLVVGRHGSPVIIGIGDGEMFVASDAAALIRHTRQIVHLDDGELATVRADGFQSSMLDGGRTDKEPLSLAWTDESFDKGDHDHYMRKEIGEQGESVRRTLRGRLEKRFQTARLGGLEMAARELLDVRRVKILGCGSAYIAGCLGAHMIEQLARIPAHAEQASEFRYRNPVIEKDCLYIAVSQSGETFDTLAAVQEIKRKGGAVLGVVNVVGSTIARECGRGIYLHAGPEVSVVSTKTFTCTAVAFALLALHLGRIRDLSSAYGGRLIAALEALPAQIERVDAQAASVSKLASVFDDAANACFIGRTWAYALAMEGALKLKEISYLHAEAYPASELKHGPLALIEPATPTLIVLPDDELLPKNLSTIEEIHARQGPVVAVAHPGVAPESLKAVIEVPKSDPILDPILMNIPLQLLAYQVALQRGTNVDKPRNLAKSVTVE
jgi:glutamine---fructose-6-phosphate transaminase (isomerizing)